MMGVLLGCSSFAKNRLENQHSPHSPLPSVASVLEASKTLRESSVAMDRTDSKISSVRCELSIAEFVVAGGYGLWGHPFKSDFHTDLKGYLRATQHMGLSNEVCPEIVILVK